MTHRRSKLLFTALFCLATPMSLTAMAADQPPEKPVGLSGVTEAVGVVDLAPHNLAGPAADYDLRARTIGIAPGGAIHSHPHAGRPGIAYLTKGNIVEYRGSTERSLKVGDWWLETADTVHWFRNPSNTEAAELWVVDLVPRKK